MNLNIAIEKFLQIKKFTCSFLYNNIYISIKKTLSVNSSV